MKSKNSESNSFSPLSGRQKSAFFASQGALCVSLEPLEQMKAHFIRKKDVFSLLCILVSVR